MAQPAREGDAVDRQTIGPVRKPKRVLHIRAEMHHAGARIVTEIDMSVMGVTLFVVKLRSGLDMPIGLLELPTKVMRSPSTMMCLQHDLAVLELTRYSHHVSGNLFSAIEPTASNIEDPQVGDCRRNLA